MVMIITTGRALEHPLDQPEKRKLAEDLGNRRILVLKACVAAEFCR
jgi:hypothetical protein